MFPSAESHQPMFKASQLTLDSALVINIYADMFFHENPLRIQPEEFYAVFSSERSLSYSLCISGSESLLGLDLHEPALVSSAQLSTVTKILNR